MKAYVTSIGESTTDLCIWALERNGFDVVLLKSKDSLLDKLKRIYEQANDDFVRVDADVVVNKSLTVDYVKQLNLSDEYWWTQLQTFDWFKQTVMYGGVQVIKKEAIQYLRKYADSFKNSDRPETQLSRIDEFHSPRRFTSLNFVAGIHGFAQNDTERVIAQKRKRDYFDTYDFELANKLEGLLK